MGERAAAIAIWRGFASSRVAAPAPSHMLPLGRGALRLDEHLFITKKMVAAGTNAVVAVMDRNFIREERNSHEDPCLRIGRRPRPCTTCYGRDSRPPSPRSGRAQRRP